MDDYLNLIKDKMLLSAVMAKDIKIVKKGGVIKGLCPFHQEKTPSLHINDQKGVYYCFGCGAKGDVISYLMAVKKLSFNQVLEQLCAELGIEKTVTKITTENKSQYFVLDLASKWFVEQLHKNHGEKAKQYLASRGISPQTVQEFCLGFAPNNNNLYDYLLSHKISHVDLIESGLFVYTEQGDLLPRFRNRLIFPIFNKRKQVIAFGGRILSTGEPKYLNSPETVLFKKKQVLYGLEKVQSNLPLLVVEGYMDVISLYQTKNYSAVAPMGTSLTTEQLENIWTLKEQPILCFDGDLAGIRATYRAIHTALPVINTNKSLKIVWLPNGLDPDSMIKQGLQAKFQDLVDKANPLITVLWQEIIKDFDSQKATPEQKLKIQQQIKKIAFSINEKALAKIYEKDLLNYYYQIWKKKTLPISPHVAIGNKRHDVWEKILLASLINHPYLLDMMIERLVAINFYNHPLEELRKLIINAYVDNPLNWANHLCQVCDKSLLDSVLNDDLVYVLAPFCKKETSNESLLKGVNEIWYQMTEKNYLQQDLVLFRDNLKNNFDKDQWEKFKRLKNKIFEKDDKDKK